MIMQNPTVLKLIDLLTIDKRFSPGDKLPSEIAFAKELGVSRNTLRTATQYLVGQGVLEVRAGSGTFVASNPPVLDDFGFGRLQHVQLKLNDLYELRLMLEPQITFYAALRATDKELQEIQQYGETVLQATRDNKEEDTEGNRLFHNAIARAAHNEFAYDIMMIINEALIKAFQENDKKQSLSAENLFDHRMIMHYLTIRNPEGANQAMDLHIRSSIDAYNILDKPAGNSK